MHPNSSWTSCCSMHDSQGRSSSLDQSIILSYIQYTSQLQQKISAMNFVLLSYKSLLLESHRALYRNVLRIFYLTWHVMLICEPCIHQEVFLAWGIGGVSGRVPTVSSPSPPLTPSTITGTALPFLSKTNRKSCSSLL